MSSAINLAFLMSMPRSGSTLLSLMLGNHPAVYAPPEPWLQVLLADFISCSASDQYVFDESTATTAVAALFSNIAKDAAGQAVLSGVLQQLLSSDLSVEQAGRAGREIYREALRLSGKQLFLDKTPRNYHAIEFMEVAYPEAKLILLKRNPLDVALSYKTTWGVSVRELVGEVLTSNTLDFAKGLFDLEGLAGKNAHDVLEISYEELIGNPEPSLQRICGFLALAYSPSMLDFHENEKMLSEHARSGVGDPKIHIGGGAVHAQSVSGWSQGLDKEEISMLVGFLGGEVFQRLGYGSVLGQLAALDIAMPAEQEARNRRAKVLDQARVKRRPAEFMGRWSYLMATAGLSAYQLEDGVNAIASIFMTEANVTGQIVRDLAIRLRAADVDRMARLAVIRDSERVLSRLEKDRLAHIDAIADLTNVLKEASSKLQAQDVAIEELTSALRIARQERDEALASGQALSGLLNEARNSLESGARENTQLKLSIYQLEQEKAALALLLEELDSIATKAPLRYVLRALGMLPLLERIRQATKH